MALIYLKGSASEPARFGRPHQSTRKPEGAPFTTGTSRHRDCRRRATVDTHHASAALPPERARIQPLAATLLAQGRRGTNDRKGLRADRSDRLARGGLRRFRCEPSTRADGVRCELRLDALNPSSLRAWPRSENLPRPESGVLFAVIPSSSRHAPRSASRGPLWRRCDRQHQCTVRGVTCCNQRLRD
jgi:hypothetical protein